MKHGYRIMTLRLSSSRRCGSRQIHRGRKKTSRVRSNVKYTLVVFFDIQGIFHKEFVPTDQTVNGKFYFEILKWLREGIWRKRPYNWKNNNWFLHNDNAPAHTSLVVRQFLSSTSITVIPHPLPIRLTSPPVTFSYSQEEIAAEKASFWHDWGDPRRFARDYRHNHIWELRGMHEIMGNTLGSLYTCPRGLLRRRRWKLGITVRNIFMVKFTEFLGSTSYIRLSKHPYHSTFGLSWVLFMSPATWPMAKAGHAYNKHSTGRSIWDSCVLYLYLSLSLFVININLL